MKAIIILSLISLYLCGKRETVVDCAIEKIGTSYETMNSAGLTRTCYLRIGINLDTIAHNQFVKGKAVDSISGLKPGDLVGFINHDGKKQPGHVGIYVGNNKYIHAPGPGKKVSYGTLSSNKNYYGGRNYID